MSAAALVSARGRQWFVKRHSILVRTVDQLEVEHAFTSWLARGGITVPTVAAALDGHTAVAWQGAAYEVHAPVPGDDLYRDAMSWTPYQDPEHARSAGRALARLHGAAAGFDHPSRPPGVLTDSCVVVAAADPLSALAEWVDSRPLLAAYLSSRPWPELSESQVQPLLESAAAAGIAAQLPLWTHGDWHPSNLTWKGVEVEAVFDLGLCNRTFALHDLAVAIERACIRWLDIAAPHDADGLVDWAGMRGLLAGYDEIWGLGTKELAVLAGTLPVAHVEFALSEIEYFSDVVGSPANARLAFEDYLIGHARWWSGPEGRLVLDSIRAGSF